MGFSLRHLIQDEGQLVKKGVASIGNIVGRDSRPQPDRSAEPALNTQTLRPYGTGEVVSSPQALRSGNSLIKQSNASYGFTPNFLDTLNKSNPAVGSNLNSSALAAGQAAGTYDPTKELYSPTSIDFSNTGGTVDSLVHEGLHRDWQNNPATRQQFTQAYDQTNDPKLRFYLQGRVASYKEAQPLMDEGGVYTNDFKKLESLPVDLQNEVHSYIPEYYHSRPVPTAPPTGWQYKQHPDGIYGWTDPQGKPGTLPITTKSVPLPQPLQQYYGQYFGPPKQNSVVDNLRHLFGRF